MGKHFKMYQKVYQMKMKKKKKMRRINVQLVLKGMKKQRKRFHPKIEQIKEYSLGKDLLVYNMCMTLSLTV